MKLTEKQIRKIKKLKKKGLRISEIARKFKVSEPTIRYHFNEKYREKIKKKSRDIVRNLTKKQMRERNKKNYPYHLKYFKNRYDTDSEFRKKIIEGSKKCQRELYYKRKGLGLCPECGNKRKDKTKIICKKCRDERVERERIKRNEK